MMISFSLGATESSLAEPLVADTEARLCREAMPLWVSDGLDAYGGAPLSGHHVLETYPRTGNRGRPRRPKLVACHFLRYVQVVKERDERRRVVGVFRRAMFGDVPLDEIKTVFIERHNLNLRHENRRLTRKTVAFSKQVIWLERQMHLYQAYYNLARSHRGLRQRLDGGKVKWKHRSPAVAAGVTDHVWTLRELMCYKVFINY
jgi:IS1 family transposase